MLSTLNFSSKQELCETAGMHRRLAAALILTLTACAPKLDASPSSSTAPATFSEYDGVGINADSCAAYLEGAPPESIGEFLPVSDEMMAAAMASIANETQPRCAHYHFVHRILSEQILDDPRIATAMWERDDVAELLDAYAEVVNDVCVNGDPGAWTIPPSSFRIGRTEVLGRPVVVVDVMPPPVATTEAHMFAVVGVPWAEGADRRVWPGFEAYLVLEHSVSQGPTHTVMGAWTRMEGSLTHLNMGEGPLPEPGGFVHAIGRNLCGNFVEMRTRM